MAVTIQADGKVRPDLRLVGDNHPTIEVQPLRVEAIVKYLNSLQAGEVMPADEATAFERIVGAAISQGMELQREMAEAS